jgi:hypothetical protein
MVVLIKVYFFYEALHKVPLLFDVHIHLTDNEYSGYLHHIIAGLKVMKIVACSVTVDVETTVRGFKTVSAKSVLTVHMMFPSSGRSRSLAQCLSWQS